ncbi:MULTISPECIES: hypothetical protein [Streptomyces]|uniref:hypothetical protein n=1 Tax=Streptomyces TaxID=1883 RepID=UPI0011CDAADB|nr:hypothetical protein [Streptomyces botrytidirepellens]
MAKGGSPEGRDRLKTNESGKAGAAKALREDIRPDTGTAGTKADEETSKAVVAFNGWATATGLTDVQAEWDLQVQRLQARLSADETALQRTAQDFLDFDYQTGNGLSRQNSDLLDRFHAQSRLDDN